MAERTLVLMHSVSEQREAAETFVLSMEFLSDVVTLLLGPMEIKPYSL